MLVKGDGNFSWVKEAAALCVLVLDNQHLETMACIQGTGAPLGDWSHLSFPRHDTQALGLPRQHCL